MRKNERRFYSLIIAFAMIINMIVPSIVSASEVVKSNDSVTISVERRVLGQEDIVPLKEFQLTNGNPEKGSYVIDRFLKEENIHYDNPGSLDENFYLSWIDASDADGGLAEFDHGELSGWKYSVNGEFPSVGLSEYELQPGDEVRLCYTAKDMGLDILFVDKLDELKQLKDNASSIDKAKYTQESVGVLEASITEVSNELEKYINIGEQLSTSLGEGNLNINEVMPVIEAKVVALKSAIDSLVEVSTQPVPEADYFLDLLRFWTEYDTYYLREDQESINAELRWFDSEDEIKLNGEVVKTYGDKYILTLRKGLNVITVPEFGKPVDKFVDVRTMPYTIEGKVAPGETITLKLEGLQRQLDNPERHPLEESQTRYKTDIPGLKEISSDMLEGENPEDSKLSEITFTIPSDTEPGTYNLTNGRVHHAWGYASMEGISYMYKDFSILPEIVLDVKEEVEIPEVDYELNLLRFWTEYDTIFLRQDQDTVNIELIKWFTSQDTIKLNGELVNPYGDRYILTLEKGLNTISTKYGDKYVDVKTMPHKIEGTVAPGETVTLKLDGLTRQLDNPERHPLKKSQTRYKTDIPGLKEITSEMLLGENPEDSKLAEITFTIPSDTELGEYNLTSGRVYHEWGYASIDGIAMMQKDFSVLPEIVLNVTDGSEPESDKMIYDIDLSSWSEYDTVYTTQDKGYVSVNGEVIELNIGDNTITIDGNEHSIKCKKVSYEVQNPDSITPGSKVTVKLNGVEEAFAYIQGSYNPYDIKSKYNTNIEGLDAVTSATAGGMGGSSVDREILNTIEFTIPKETQAGEYTLTNGGVHQGWYGGKLPGAEFDNSNGGYTRLFSKLPDIKIDVKGNTGDTTPPTIITNLQDIQTVYHSEFSFTARVSDSEDESPKLVVKLDGNVVSSNRPGRYEVRLLEGENTITIEATDKSGNKTVKDYTVICSPVLKPGASISLDREYLKLQVGDIHQIIAVEAPDSRSDEDDPTARMTYDVVEGEDVVKVNNYGKLEALKLGKAKINVKYPGLQKPGVIVVNVVENKQSDDPKIITDIKETKYDTFYYTDDRNYSFEVSSPEADNIEVRVNDTIVNGSKGKYDVNLSEGDNIIHIKATKGSNVNEVYHNIKAKPVTINVKNATNEGQEIVQGDTVRVEFEGLQTPVAKFLRVYNPKNTRVAYDVDMPGMTNIFGQGTQYDLATNNAIEFVATKAGTFNFTNGHIDESWWGDDLFSERDISGEGPNTNAPVKHDTFSNIPEFSVTVKENSEYEDKYVAVVENKDNLKPGSEVVIRIDNLTTAVPDAYKIYTEKTIYNTDIKGLETVTSQEAKDNVELLKEIRFTLPNDLAPGTYTITNGRVFKEWEGNSILSVEKEFYKGELPEIKIEVKGDEVVDPEIPQVDINEGIKHASDWVVENNQNPTYQDEWEILGLVRGDIEVPGTYYKTYYSNLVDVLEEKDGELHKSKYSEYSRVIMALTALGYDPTNVGGYNLVEKLYDLDKIDNQGINGVIFALIALDTREFEIQGDKNSRDMMINYILERQLEDGGFALSGNKGDTDITAMAIQALSNYQDRENVKVAIDKAVNFLSQTQLETGGFALGGSLLKQIVGVVTNKSTTEENLESSAQVLVALNKIGISVDDERFVKNGNTILNAMMRFKDENGGYKHLIDSNEANAMATEQALYSLVSQKRADDGKVHLYDMSDVEQVKPEIPEGNTKPVIQASDVVLTVGDKFNPIDNVTANDKEDGDLTSSIEVVESTVDTSKAGTYKVVYRVIDSKGLEATKQITVVVKEAPTPSDDKLKVGIYTDEKALYESVEVEYKEGDTAYTVLKRLLGDRVITRGDNETLYVEGIDDLYEFDKGSLSGWVYGVNRKMPSVSAGIFDVNPGDEIIWHYTLDLGKDITNSYDKFDKFVNGEGETPTPPPTENQAPTITASDVELEVGAKFDPMTGVVASDKEDGDLTKSIKVIENTVDTSKEGTYKVVYEVADSKGLKSTKDITVKVIKVIEKVDVENLIKHASDWVLNNVKAPGYEDEWKVLGLKRGDIKVDKDYYTTYYNDLVKELKEKNGQLHRSKYTEYSRVIITLTALGYDPTNVGGYNLVEKLYDLDAVSKQGINGVIFALIALDTDDFEIKGDKNSRDMMINYIIERQLKDGGFALTGKTGEVDITAMAIQALANYKDKDNVKSSIDKALAFLSKSQLASGGFGTNEGENLESCAQVLVAMNSLGMSAADEMFTKNGKTVVDAISTFKSETGGYKHVSSEKEANSMATEQALYSLVSQERLNKGKTSLYDMSDVKDGSNGNGGLGTGNGNNTNPDKGPSPETSDTSILPFVAIIILATTGVVLVNRKKSS